jgi:rare lipoprotein A
MRLFSDDRRDFGSKGRSSVLRRALIPLASALVLAACASGDRGPGPVALSAYGPQDDYPVVVGEPYEIAGTTYTPEDVLNYDEVGFVTADALGGDAVTGSHHTLPLPSYVEVTSLDSGRTILVRLERRGPMDGQGLIALSPGAMTQLGGNPGSPVRVRRVNPPEDQRTLLRMGQAAAPRMDTPMSLVEILRRRLPGAGRSTLPPVPPLPAQPASTPAENAVGAPQPVPGSTPDEETPLTLPALTEATARAPAPAPAPASSPEAAPARTPAAVPAKERRFQVQVAAFSTADRAERAAQALGGQVTRAGVYFRVRTGPFASRREAEASLAKVRAAGYSDARILTSG